MNSGQIQTTAHSGGTYGFVGSSATHQTHCTPNVPNAHAQDCTQKYPPIDPLLGFPGPPLYEVPQLPSSIQYPDHKIGDVVKHEYIRQCQDNPKWVSVDQAAGTWEYTSKDVMNMAEQGRENRTTGKIPSDTGHIDRIWKGNSYYGPIARVIAHLSYSENSQSQSKWEAEAHTVYAHNTREKCRTPGKERNTA
jgi:hypothetical protein